MTFANLPCGLGAFVAERHGMPLSEAETLIEHWLSHYESMTPRRHSAPGPAAHGGGAGGFPLSFESSFGPSVG
jgi:hypothetical protein